MADENIKVKVEEVSTRSKACNTIEEKEKGNKKEKKQEKDKKTMATTSPPSLTSLESFLYGALAKFIATILSYPLQVAQSRLRQIDMTTLSSDQVQRNVEDNIAFLSRLNFQYWNAKVKQLVGFSQEMGFSAWYQGIETKLIQTVLNSALMLMTYEKIFNRLRNRLACQQTER